MTGILRNKLYMILLLTSLIFLFHRATMTSKQLKEPFSMLQLRETMIQILEMFMNTSESNYWIHYLVPDNVNDYKQQMAMSAKGFDDSSILMDATKLEQLLFETHAVLSRYANKS